MTDCRSERDARALLDEIAAEYQMILKENLVGIYEHGSLAFGCFRWAISDIDFLVVVRKPLKQHEKESVIRVLMNKRERAPVKGFEMSVVLAESLKPFIYPTPFELHYSEHHLEKIRGDLTAYCAQMHGTDQDLAAHCTVILAKGCTVAGADIVDVFGEVPRQAYLDSILYDVEQAETEISENTVYTTLNLCRVLAAVKERKVLSKAEGGRWGMEKLDEKWRELIGNALSSYENGTVFQIKAEKAREFAQSMLAEINRQIKDQSLE